MSTHNVETQLLRNMLPRSRPSHGILEISSSKPMPQLIRLFPGAYAVGSEEMVVSMELPTIFEPDWCAMRVGFSIDRISFATSRPAYLFLKPSDVYSAVVHFPVMAGSSHRLLGGHHTILMRVYASS